MNKIAAIFAGILFPSGLLLAAGFADMPFMPTNPPEMRPIHNHLTAAYRAAEWFQHGVNLGNYFEVAPGGNWAVHISAADFAQMKQEGFDHVRVPVGWQYYAGPGPDFTIDPAFFARVDWAVTNALAQHLAVMINIHDFDKMDKDPVATTPEFLALWRQIAAHYASFPPQLVFELDNEPHDHATTALMNPIYAQAILEIRRSNPQRTLFVEPGMWGGIGELKNLVLPPDRNVIVSVHCYEPFHFTHQGASWAGPDERLLTGIQFPGPPTHPLVPDPDLHLKSYVLDWVRKYNTLPPDKNPSGPAAFTSRLKYVSDWSEYYGRPVHLGEFGAYDRSDPVSRLNFYSAMRHVAEQNKIGWCIWDWNAGFHYWDSHKNRAIPGMHEALFGP